MNEKAVAEKKANKKTFWKFVALMVASMAIGAVLGVGMVSFEGGIAAAVLGASAWLQWAAPWLLLASTVVLLAGEGVALRLGKRKAALVDPDADVDDPYQAAEKTLDWALQFGNWYQVLSYTLFGVAVTAGIQAMQPLALVMVLVVFFVGMLANIALQGAVVNAVKNIYPEKRGNVLDTKFQKDWMNSCDEAEQQMIGKAALKSMRSTAHAIIALFFAAMLLSFFGLVQPLVPIALGAVWLVQTTSYMAEARRIERAHKG